ncbi:hypothetical protein AcW2_006038 [Taiwanofungus camphoratus]|nr:hypothetical protein AcW2_006038 [Antrodia cinnamomea]
MSIRDPSPIFSFDDPIHFDSALETDHMIFDFDDGQPKSPFGWDPAPDYNLPIPFPGSPESASSQLDTNSPFLLPSDRNHSPGFLSGQGDILPPPSDFNDLNLYSHWLTDPEPSLSYSSSAPIPIPASHSLSPQTQAQAQAQSQSQPPFVAYSDSSSVFPDVTAFSPLTAYAALQPLPRSYTPEEDTIMTDALRADAQASLSPPDASLTPAWAAQPWEPSNVQNVPHTSSPLSFPPLSEDAYATQRQRVTARRGLTPVTQVFQSSSAPTASHTRPPPLARSYSRRAGSISEHDDHDATIRKKKRAETKEEEMRPVEKGPETPPLKSTLRPPKLAPSAWQLYFTDWIARHQASSSKKLNVAQAAKEAGQEYAKLSSEEKEPYKRRSQAAKEARERELAAYMRTLTPEDIKRENAFRTAQRKAGKSRKGNIKDPNAPKKPLSAYFMFLQRIRSDPDLVKEVFGDETETTKQSVLAAGKWRSMTDEERKVWIICPFMVTPVH